MNIKIVLFLVFFPFTWGVLAQVQSCPEGMISYWKFDQVYNDTILIDSYGTNNAEGDLEHMPVLSGGIFNNSLMCDSNALIIVPSDSIYNWGTNESFSIEIWMYSEATTESIRVYINRYSGPKEMAWWLGYNYLGHAGFSLRDSEGDWIEIYGTTKVNDNAWHHIVGVKEDSSQLAKLYVDGILESEVQKRFTGNFYSTEPIYIGRHAANYDFKGWLDEIAIYNKALTNDEIIAHYQNMKNGIDYCDSIATSVDENTLPNEYQLYQNYPNPFNPLTNIRFSIPEAGNVQVKVYDILGNELKILINKWMPSGNYEIQFDGINYSSGVYFYKLISGHYQETRKMMILK